MEGLLHGAAAMLEICSVTCHCFSMPSSASHKENYWAERYVSCTHSLAPSLDKGYNDESEHYFILAMGFVNAAVEVIKARHMLKHSKG